MKLKNQKREIIKNAESSELEIDNSEEGKSLQFQLVMEKLYKDPLQATIREIISNAIDANKEVNSKKIKITLPTINDDCCWVRDYGIGISPKKMKDVYMKVFTSTKRENNENIGCYGIGRLSCLSLAQQYPLVTIYEGREYHYAIYMNSKGVPECSYLNSYETSEPAGTAVGIPLSKENQNRQSFRNNRSHLPEHLADYHIFILNMLAYSDVELECATLESYLSEIKHSFGYHLSTKLWAINFSKLNKSNYSRSAYYGRVDSIDTVLTIGGVPYAIPQSFLGNADDCYGRSGEDIFNYLFIPTSHHSEPTYIDKKTRLFMKGIEGPYTGYPFINMSSNINSLYLTSCALEIKVPIGELDLSSSRESILETESNKKIIYNYLFQTSLEVADYYLSCWNECNSWEELAKLSQQHSYLLALAEFSNSFGIKKINGVKVLHHNAKSLGEFVHANMGYGIHLGAYLGSRHGRGVSMKLKIPSKKEDNFLPPSDKNVLGSFIAESSYSRTAIKINFNELKQIKYVFHYSESFSSSEVYAKRLPYDFDSCVSVVFLIKEGEILPDKWSLLKDNGFDVFFLYKKNNTARTKKTKDVGKFIRPLDLEGLKKGGESWKQIFSKEPVGYQPTGYYVTKEYSAERLANCLRLFNDEELNQIYFVSIGAAALLDPQRLQPFEKLINSRRNSRSNIENSLLYALNLNYKPEEVISVFLGIRDELTPKALSFFENYREYSRQLEQERQYNQLWTFNSYKYKYDITDKDVCEYLFGSDYDEYQSLLAFLIEYKSLTVSQLQTLKKLYVNSLCTKTKCNSEDTST